MQDFLTMHFLCAISYYKHNILFDMMQINGSIEGREKDCD
jgi:hypothetical protein